MKKLLAVAVATTMSATVMADVSITGDAKFEYINTNTDNGTTSTSANQTNTEVNFNLRGKNGATNVVADISIKTHGDNETTTTVAGTTTNVGSPTANVATNTTRNRIVVEDLYLTTKLGPVNAKLGNYSSSTTGLLGEIENGGRATNKMTFSYTTNGIKFYAGNSGREKGTGATAINNNLFAGVVATVEGWKLEAKKNNENKNSVGANGTVGPVGIRVEYAKADKVGNVDSKDTGFFVGLTGKISNINLGLNVIDMDNDGGITEDDSSIFAVSNAGAGNSNIQLHASMDMDGTTYSANIGKIGFSTADTATTDNQDRNYYRVRAQRTLASGITAQATYLNQDTSDTADKQTFEIDLSVKF